MKTDFLRTRDFFDSLGIVYHIENNRIVLKTSDKVHGQTNMPITRVYGFFYHEADFMFDENGKFLGVDINSWKRLLEKNQKKKK